MIRIRAFLIGLMQLVLVVLIFAVPVVAHWVTYLAFTKAPRDRQIERFFEFWSITICAGFTGACVLIDDRMIRFVFVAMALHALGVLMMTRIAAAVRSADLLEGGAYE